MGIFIKVEKKIIKAIFFLIVSLSLGSCEKIEPISGNEIAGENGKGAEVSALSFSTAQISKLRQGFIASNNTKLITNKMLENETTPLEIKEELKQVLEQIKKG